MIAFPGQTLLFDILFFVPRAFWDSKPYGYHFYFTSYAFYGIAGKEVSNMTFQVNLWSEFISNAGIFGMALALFFVIWSIKISERSKSVLVYLSGSLFVILYMMYGFEHIVQFIYVVWICSMIMRFVKKHIKV